MQDLVPIENADPRSLFVPGGLDALLSTIEAQARSVAPDIRSSKGRAAVASNAARVAKAKVYLDGLGKDYVAALKELPKQVDAERKRMRDRLDSLRDEVRAPLTKWEEEQRRKAEVTDNLVARLSAPVALGTPSSEISQRLDWVGALTVPEGLDEDQENRIIDAMNEAGNRLSAALQSSIKAEKEAEELDRLRREAAEHARKEREAQIAKEAAERATREAEAKAAAEAERQRMAAAEAERRIKEAEERAEKAAQAERYRIAVEQAAERRATEKRKADEEHKAAVEQDAVASLLEHCKMTSNVASCAVKAISQGLIKGVTISY